MLPLDEVQAFFEAEQEAARQLRLGTEGHLLIVDARDFIPQTQEVFGEFRKMIALRSLRARRAAIIVGQALSRLQLRRMVEGESDVAIFTNSEEAEAWLRSTN